MRNDVYNIAVLGVGWEEKGEAVGRFACSGHSTPVCCCYHCSLLVFPMAAVLLKYSPLFCMFDPFFLFRRCIDEFLPHFVSVEFFVSQTACCSVVGSGCSLTGRSVLHAPSGISQTCGVAFGVVA